MINAIIFDLDNTLVDFMQMKDRAVDSAIHAMIDAGLDMSIEESKKRIKRIYDLEGIEYQGVLSDFIYDVLKEENHKIISAGVVGYRKAREAELKPYSRVYPTLLELMKMGIKLAIVSDAPSKEAWLRLSALNFHHIFDVVVTFDDTKCRKPTPKPFRLALKKLKLKASECLMIGDWAERDVVGAKAVGMKTVFARYGDTFNTVHPGSDYDINCISELIKIVKKENKIRNGKRNRNRHN